MNIQTFLKRNFKFTDIYRILLFIDRALYRPNSEFFKLKFFERYFYAIWA